MSSEQDKTKVIVEKEVAALHRIKRYDAVPNLIVTNEVEQFIHHIAYFINKPPPATLIQVMGTLSADTRCQPRHRWKIEINYPRNKKCVYNGYFIFLAKYIDYSTLRVSTIG